MRRQAKQNYDPNYPETKRDILVCLSQIQSDQESRWQESLHMDDNRGPCMVTKPTSESDAKIYCDRLNKIGIPAKTEKDASGNSVTVVELDSVALSTMAGQEGNDLYFKYIELLRKLSEKLNKEYYDKNARGVWSDQRVLGDSYHGNVQTLFTNYNPNQDYGKVSSKQIFEEQISKLGVDAVFPHEKSLYIHPSHIPALVNQHRPESALDVYVNAQNNLINQLQEAVMRIQSNDKLLQSILGIIDAGKNKGSFDNVINGIKEILPAKPKGGVATLFMANKQINTLCDIIRNATPDNHQAVQFALSDFNAGRLDKPKASTKPV